MKKILLLSFFILIAAAAWYAYSEWNRKPATAADKATDFKVSANDIVNEFVANETDATKKYLEKMVEVTGVVSEVSPNGKNTDVVLQTEDPMTSVTIQLIPEESEKAKNLKVGESVTLKGKCNGFNMGVEMNLGVIL